MKPLRSLALAACLAAPALPGGAADFSDPTWPCIQRKVGALSAGLMWPAPPEEVTLDEAEEAAVRELVGRLTLRRLPVEKRGRLISISVADHYVEVATSAGSALILMRLTDAMAETGDTPGLQVHRSHWVAIGEVTAARRDGARAILTLSDGRDIPVSRTYVPAVKEAGLLP